MQSSSLFAWIALVLCVLALRMEHAQEPQLAPGDRLHITVSDRPELTTEAEVNRDGSITFPHLGRVHLAGLSRMLAESYLAERLLADGGVSGEKVDVQVLSSRTVKLAEAHR
jgi:protein involved in polysaccharide export with SLBB domain